MTLFLTAVVAGIAVGSIYAIVGIGYTVIFSATRVFNLAQGDLVMVGVMSSYYLLVVLNRPWGRTMSTMSTRTTPARASYSDPQ